jgi:hypothetical protein
MNRPSLSVRFAGSPRGALLLFLLYAAIGWGWYEGQVSWWIALGAVGAAVRTLRAVPELRRYEAWQAEWQSMEGGGARPQAKKRRGRAWALIITAILLAILIPLSSSEERSLSPELTALWCAAIFCLVCAFIWGITRRIRNRRSRRTDVPKGRGGDASVEWLLGRASSSPSRADAEQNLPEYCARLLVSK